MLGMSAAVLMDGARSAFASEIGAAERPFGAGAHVPDGRIQRLLDRELVTNLRPKPVAVEFDPADMALPEPVRIGKRLAEYMAAQPVVIREDEEFVGWLPFDATGGTAGSGAAFPPPGQDGVGDGSELPEGGAGEGEGNYQPDDQSGSDGNSGLPPDAPEDTPTPEPGELPDEDSAPEDTPTPEPEGAPDAADAPEDGDTPEDGDAPEDGDTPEDGDAPEDGRERGGGHWWLLLALLLIGLIAVTARWVMKRLRLSDPAALCGSVRSYREAAMILYRANLTVLAHLGQTPAGGESPGAFARRAAT